MNSKNQNLNSLFGNVAGNNLEEISTRYSDASLSRDFLLKSYFDLKLPKTFFKKVYLSTKNCYLPDKVPFYNFKCFFLFFGRFPMILDYSLCVIGILDMILD